MRSCLYFGLYCSSMSLTGPISFPAATQSWYCETSCDESIPSGEKHYQSWLALCVLFHSYLTIRKSTCGKGDPYLSSTTFRLLRWEELCWHISPFLVALVSVTIEVAYSCTLSSYIYNLTCTIILYHIVRINKFILKLPNLRNSSFQLWYLSELDVLFRRAS